MDNDKYDPIGSWARTFNFCLGCFESFDQYFVEMNISLQDEGEYEYRKHIWVALMDNTIEQTEASMIITKREEFILDLFREYKAMIEKRIEFYEQKSQ